MAGIAAKRINNFAKPSAWAQMQSWRERRQAVSENFAVASSNLISSFADAWDNQSMGLAEVAVNRANTRIQGEIRAKYGQLLNRSI